MANNKTILITKSCEACQKDFLVCPSGKFSRSCRKTFEDKFCSRECRHNSRYRVGSNANILQPTEAAYIAGFLDGEGSIILYSRSNKNNNSISSRLSFSNTNLGVLNYIKQLLGVGNIVTKPSYNLKHKTGYQLTVNSDAARTVLEQVLPFLIIKKTQAEIAIEFQNNIKTPALKADRDWQIKLRDRIRLLNKRGQPPELTVTE